MKINIDYKKLNIFCKKWNIVEFALFGSVLREDFNSESDVDVLISFDEDVEISLFDLVEIKEELESFFGRKVDVVEKKAIKNPYRVKDIFSNMEILYAV
ncbi:MAG: nucleotidyltransferase family protein [bacterium]